MRSHHVEAYVALSRATSMDTLEVRNFNPIKWVGKFCAAFTSKEFQGASTSAGFGLDAPKHGHERTV